MQAGLRSPLRLTFHHNTRLWPVEKRHDCDQRHKPLGKVPAGEPVEPVPVSSSYLAEAD